MQKLLWAALPLFFLFGCFAHSLTHDAFASPPPLVCTTREEFEELRARVIALEDRLDTHASAIRYFKQSLGLREE
jgi:hypothetical protein